MRYRWCRVPGTFLIKNFLYNLKISSGILIYFVTFNYSRQAYCISHLHTSSQRPLNSNIYSSTNHNAVQTFCHLQELAVKGCCKNEYKIFQHLKIEHKLIKDMNNAHYIKHYIIINLLCKHLKVIKCEKYFFLHNFANNCV